jgi:mediator of RNA polymerase II transcription subunit 17
MAAGRQAIMLDPLPMKRLLALEESGTEHLPPELSQEEKPLALLGRIDFGQEAKKVKSESNGSSKEEEEVVPPTWPWQGLVEHLQQADQELVVILDLITQVCFRKLCVRLWSLPLHPQKVAVVWKEWNFLLFCTAM